jgi:hypothetical protein
MIRVDGSALSVESPCGTMTSNMPVDEKGNREMTNDEFTKIDAELLAASNAVLLERETSYAEGGDRLANFKRIAREVGLTPEKVCEVYLHKALCSVTKLLNGQEVKGEPVVSRFSDVMNYVRLAYALIREKQTPQLKLQDIFDQAQRPIVVRHDFTPLRATNRVVD